ncbi:M20/M25/M40 family metallo-hydrolase [Sciscionella marina]|uniref:M20/M25/M40 family metallo-hydrolase n=1 Tax=Sciscionella marina TaxID=508770 RepID=UPI0003698688|nr:M20/M25/M40 family metallo-hydrolase [Sciscionella marina]
MPDPIELTQQLVRLDTRGGGELAAAELLAEPLRAAGFTVRLGEPEPGRANLVARLGHGTPITLTGHLDTVPADPAGWSFDPHSGEIDGDRLRGRGSSDMKAGVAAIVAAAIATPAPVQLVFTFGEETGCEGAAQITELEPSPLLLVAEPTANRIVLGHKGALWLRLSARGRSAHGSRPELGENAVFALARACERIHHHPDWPSSPTHGAATVNIGTFHAGSQPNLVPDHAEAQLDIRTVPGFSADTARAGIAELAGAETGIETLLDLPSIDTDPADPLVAELTGTLCPDWTPQYATYFTDAARLSATLGDPAVLVYGPGEPEQAHVTDETCSVAAIGATTAALRRLLGAWAERD